MDIINIIYMQDIGFKYEYNFIYIIIVYNVRDDELK